MDVTILLGGDFIMIKKGAKFQTYSDELKIQVVNLTGLTPYISFLNCPPIVRHKLNN